MKLIGEPRAGFYTTRLSRDGIMVGVMFWHGCPVIGGERQDRSPRWCVAVDGNTINDDGELLDPFETWPFCKPTTHREFGFLKRHARWARTHDPDHPRANPRRPIDRRAMRPIF